MTRSMVTLRGMATKGKGMLKAQTRASGSNLGHFVKIERFLN